MGVTQQEIAGQAGVSPTTVSLVLNGRADELNISPECARRVLDTARKLGYRSNYHARALARGKATTLGFVNRAGDGYGHLFGHTLSSGVERRARELGYDLLLFGSGEGDMHLTRGVEGLVEKRVDALLLPYFHGRLIKHDHARRWPMVLIQSEPGNGYPAVNLDAEPGIRAAVEHLADLGHHRVLWLGARAPEESWALSRLSAFREAASGFGVASTHYNIKNPEVFYGKIEDQIERAVNELRNDLPPLRETTAVMCCNDTVALALYAVLRERDLQVPRDVSVIGFDDLLASFAVPAMTTVSHMLPQIGARAVELALEIMEEGREHPYEVEVKVPAELVVRRSTCEPN